uniref:Uncharacterized protein n=1 Tax=Arion vulgaris TaxID=1028688 RepID=A0A0B7ARI0_9EUPU
MTLIISMLCDCQHLLYLMTNTVVEDANTLLCSTTNTVVEDEGTLLYVIIDSCFEMRHFVVCNDRNFCEG